MLLSADSFFLFVCFVTKHEISTLKNYENIVQIGKTEN